MPSRSDYYFMSSCQLKFGLSNQDNDFFGRVGNSLNIIRTHEKGLTHVWHEKDCKLGSFVENGFFKAW